MNMNVSLPVVLLCICVISVTVINSNKLKKIKKQHTFASLVFSKNRNITNKSHPCDWLSSLKYQNRLCWKRKGLPQVLLTAKRLSISHCEKQFEYHQWNCKHRSRLFQGRLYRETALLHALSSSALVYAIARACSEGGLSGCGCGAGSGELPDAAHWGGCGDNTRHAQAFARRFLQLTGGSKKTLVRHNSLVGIRVAVSSVELRCQCHGLSGSCSIRICYYRLPSFSQLTAILQSRYHSAVQLPTNRSKVAIPTPHPSTSSRREELVYQRASPSFCPTTTGRRCNGTANCATLCCGRGHRFDSATVKTYCDCHWSEGVRLQCKECVSREEIMICK